MSDPYFTPTTPPVQSPEPEPRSRPRRGLIALACCLLAVGTLGATAAIGTIGARSLGLVGDDPQPPTESAARAVSDRRPDAALDEYRIEVDEGHDDDDHSDTDPLDELIDSYLDDLPSSVGPPEVEVSLRPDPQRLSVDDYAARRCTVVGPSQISALRSSSALLDGLGSGSSSMRGAVDALESMDEWFSAEAEFNDEFQVDHPDGGDLRQTRAERWAAVQAAIDSFDPSGMMDAAGNLSGMDSALGLELAMAEMFAPECSELNSATLDAATGLLGGSRS